MYTMKTFQKFDLSRNKLKFQRDRKIRVVKARHLALLSYYHNKPRVLSNSVITRETQGHKACLQPWQSQRIANKNIQGIARKRKFTISGCPQQLGTHGSLKEKINSNIKELTYQKQEERFSINESTDTKIL